MCLLRKRAGFEAKSSLLGSSWQDLEQLGRLVDLVEGEESQMMRVSYLILQRLEVWPH